MTNAYDDAALHRLLDVVERDVVPLTRAGVDRGDKLFGAAVLRADDLSLVVAGTNNETVNPLWHGEVDALNRFFALPADERPAPADCVLLATHEPCSLCLSAITWSGFRRFAYVFSHRDSAESFAIPYDIAILQGVYAVPDPDRAAPAPGRDLYNRQNAYFSSVDLAAEIAASGDASLATRRASLAATYAALSDTYQRGKGAHGIPHA
ncbi:nucleoside deaminase [Luteimicrobium subarcticum]|uniref:tRNA(Arg) A34 adenosine deaminase TadA n=1 Tax=Luteimicrobium subarcticum TaxID=620910 RepID=A0A2M8WU55_9MICO|nr:nucleoside deaminase [Luteimicrobium subarcticum]PJI94470.1 tRNA(Arg) A34 adenosine deaminase TadA [Luteimicrobium subarcticum]